MLLEEILNTSNKFTSTRCIFTCPRQWTVVRLQQFCSHAVESIFNLTMSAFLMLPLEATQWITRIHCRKNCIRHCSWRFKKQVIILVYTIIVFLEYLEQKFEDSKIEICVFWWSTRMPFSRRRTIRETHRSHTYNPDFRKLFSIAVDNFKYK